MAALSGPLSAHCLDLTTKVQGGFACRGAENGRRDSQPTRGAQEDRDGHRQRQGLDLMA